MKTTEIGNIETIHEGTPAELKAVVSAMKQKRVYVYAGRLFIPVKRADCISALRDEHTRPETYTLRIRDTYAVLTAGPFQK